MLRAGRGRNGGRTYTLLLPLLCAYQRAKSGGLGLTPVDLGHLSIDDRSRF